MAKPDMTTPTVRFGILRKRKPIHGFKIMGKLKSKSEADISVD